MDDDEDYTPSWGERAAILVLLFILLFAALIGAIFGGDE